MRRIERDGSKSAAAAAAAKAGGHDDDAGTRCPVESLKHNVCSAHRTVRSPAVFQSSGMTHGLKAQCKCAAEGCHAMCVCGESMGRARND